MWHRIITFFDNTYGKRTRYDLHYSKLLIIALCICISVVIFQ